MALRFNSETPAPRALYHLDLLLSPQLHYPEPTSPSPPAGLLLPQGPSNELFSALPILTDSRSPQIPVSKLLYSQAHDLTPRPAKCSGTFCGDKNVLRNCSIQ